MGLNLARLSEGTNEKLEFRLVTMPLENIDHTYLFIREEDTCKQRLALKGENESSRETSFTVFFLSTIALFRVVFSILTIALLANIFGTSVATDAFFIAQVFTLRIGERVRRTVNLVFVPIYTDYLINHPQEESLKMTNIFASRLTIYSILAIIPFALLSPYWLNTGTYGAIGTQTRAITIKLIWFLVPALLFFINFSLCESIYLSYDEFKIPAYASLFGGVGSVVGILALSEYIGIYGVVVGATLGMFCAFAFPYLMLKKKKIHYSLSLRAFGQKEYQLDWFKNNILPVLSFGIIFQIIISIDRLFATQIAEGMASSLTYASNLVCLFPVVIASSSCISILPKLSQYYATKDFNSISTIFSKSFRDLLFVIIPLSLFIFLAGDLLIKLLLQHGKFDAIASANTLTALRFYAIGSVPHGLWIFIMGVFISLGEVKRIPLYALLLLVITVFLNYILMNLFGYIGLPLATSLVFFIQFFFFYDLLKKDFRIKVSGNNRLFISKVALAATGMGVSLWLVKNAIPTLTESPLFLHQLVSLGFLCTLALFVYITISRLVGITIPLNFRRAMKINSAINKMEITSPLESLE